MLVPTTIRTVGTTLLTLWRYYNGSDHFYTVNFKELGWGKDGYHVERPQCYVFSIPEPTTPTTQLYRYVSTEGHGHFYTTDHSELGDGTQSWKLEDLGGVVDPKFEMPGFVYPSPQAGSVPLYRYYNGNFHFYTTDFSELGGGKDGWAFEEVQCYVLPIVQSRAVFKPEENPTFKVRK